MRSISDLIHQAVGQAVGQAVADTYVIILATEFSSAESLQKFLKDRGEPITVELLIDKGILEGDPLSIVLAVELLGRDVWRPIRHLQRSRYSCCILQDSEQALNLQLCDLVGCASQGNCVSESWKYQ